MGSGTTGIGALKSERKFIGFDTNKEYIDLAERRLCGDLFAQPKKNPSKTSKIKFKLQK